MASAQQRLVDAIDTAADQITAAISGDTPGLPAGASTEATLALVKTAVDELKAAVESAPEVTVTFPATQQVSVSGTPSVSVANFPATQPVSAASLPLPSGAATELGLTALGVKLDTLAARLGDIETALADVATGADLASIQALMATDPPTGADLASIEADIEAAVAKLSSDPATAAGVTALQGSVDALVTKTSADQATGADMDAVVAQLTAILADIPAGAATDAAIDALGTIVTSSAAILPTDAATEASVDGIEGLLTTIRDRTIVGPASEATLAQARDRIVLPPALESGRLAVVSAEVADRLSAGEVSLTSVGATADLALEPTDRSVGIVMRATSASVNATMLVEQQRPDGGWHTCYVTDATSSGTTGPYTSVVLTSVGVPRWVWAPVIPGATAIRVRPLSILGGNVVAVRMSASKESPWPPIVGSNVLSAATVTPRPDATSTVSFGGPAYLFNSHGTSGTWDKPRGNLTAVAVPTNYFAADGETLSADLRTWNLSSARVLVPWYEYEPGEQATVALHGYDPVSIDYYLLGSVVIPSEAKLHCAIEIGRGIGSGALLALNRPLPPVIRVTLELAGVVNGPYTGASVEMHV